MKRTDTREKLHTFRPTGLKTGGASAKPWPVADFYCAGVLKKVQSALLAYIVRRGYLKTRSFI
jgi:hypothetical protein